MARNYILACDERGTKSWPSSNRTFTIGGFVTQDTNREHLIFIWEQIKAQLCGDISVELKWSHFFSGHHQDEDSNPLASKDPREWRSQALWALNKLFQEADLFPITTIVQKDIASDTLFTLTLKNKKIISVFQVLGATLGQFAVYLKENKGLHGEVWFDSLGSIKEETRLQEQFDQLFNALSLLSPENERIFKRINPKITFFGSKVEPLVAIADFVSGTLWAASEGDEWFFNQMLEKYAPGKQRTYGILLLQA